MIGPRMSFPEIAVPPCIPCRIGKVEFAAWVVLGMMIAARPLEAQEPIRLPAQPLTITPTFEPEGLPNRLEAGAALPAAMATTGGGETWVGCVAYSPDGKKLAVGDRPTRPICTFLGSVPINENGGLIRIINVATRRVERTIRPAKQPLHEYEILSLIYSPDGRNLIAHGIETWPREGKRREVGYHVTTWDAVTGQLVRRIDSAKLDDWQLSTFSPDASSFAASTHAGIRIWDLADGRQRATLSGSPLKPRVLAFSPDGKVIAAGDDGGEVGLWDIASGRRLAKFPAHRAGKYFFEVDLLTFSPDGRFLAWGSRLNIKYEPPDGKIVSEIHLIEMASLAERTKIPELDKYLLFSVAFSPDGKTMVASVGTDSTGTLKFWDTTTGQERAFAGRMGQAASLNYTRDGSLLVTADREWIVLRDPQDGRERAVLYQGGFSATEEVFAVSPDSRTLASSNGTFQLWDLRAATEPFTTGGHRFEVTCLAYAPDGLSLASGSFDRTVKLWDVAMRRPRITLLGHEREIVQVAYAPDGRLVASADASGQVRVWDATTGACRFVLQGSDAPHHLLAFSPDGKALSLIAWSNGDPVEIRRWDAITGERRKSTTLAPDPPVPLAFSTDGGLFVSSDELKIEVRDADTGDLRSAFSGKNEGISLSLLVCRDGKTVFQLTQDTSVVVYRHIQESWNAEELLPSQADATGIELAEAGRCMTASADGQRLAVKVNGSVRVFDIGTRRPIATLPAAAETTCLALPPDGKALATGRTNGDILLWRSE